MSSINSLTQWVTTLILFFLLPNIAYSEDGYAKLLVICAPSTLNFTITTQGSNPDDKNSSIQKEINWLHLVVARKVYLNFEKIGSKIHTEKCGRVTAKIKYGYVNPNYNGPSGADDFPLVSIYYKYKILVFPTAMEACDVNDLEAQTAVGPCHKSWAERIEISQKEKHIFITRSITNNNKTNHLLEKIYFFPI